MSMSALSTFAGVNLEAGSALGTAKPYQVYTQGFSDSTEAVELRIDTTQNLQPIEVATIVLLKALKLAMLRIIWASTKPSAVFTLKPGEIRRIDDRLIVEKTADGRILLYEVVD